MDQVSSSSQRQKPSQLLWTKAKNSSSWLCHALSVWFGNPRSWGMAKIQTSFGWLPPEKRRSKTPEWDRHDRLTSCRIPSILWHAPNHAGSGFGVGNPSLLPPEAGRLVGIPAAFRPITARSCSWILKTNRKQLLNNWIKGQVADQFYHPRHPSPTCRLPNAFLESVHSDCQLSFTLLFSHGNAEDLGLIIRCSESNSESFL